MHESPSSALPQRSRPAHLPVLNVGTRANIVFVTICTKLRRPILATEAMHQVLRQSWTKAVDWQIGRYVLMPDHLHLFCAPNLFPAKPLTGWIGYWKRLTTQAHGEEIWQKNFWDTQLRRHESYAAKWEYVRQNPVRAGLVNDADKWPFQGEVNALFWRE